MRRSLALLVFAAACQPATHAPVSKDGRLESGDATLTSGEFYDRFHIDVRQGQWIAVEVTADGFDPYLILSGPSDEQTEVDDSDPHNLRTTRLAVRVTASGRWQALVTSHAPGETGRYTLTYHITDAPPPDGQDSPESLTA